MKLQAVKYPYHWIPLWPQSPCPPYCRCWVRNVTQVHKKKETTISMLKLTAWDISIARYQKPQASNKAILIKRHLTHNNGAMLHIPIHFFLCSSKCTFLLQCLRHLCTSWSVWKLIFPFWKSTQYPFCQFCKSLLWNTPTGKQSFLHFIRLLITVLLTQPTATDTQTLLNMI